MSRSPKKPHSAARPSRNANPSSGLLTPPPSQSEQAPPMLMSPPPEETLRTPRSKSSSHLSAAGTSLTEPGVAFRVGFTGRVISNTLPGKRKRSGPSASSSTSSLAEDAIAESNHAGPSKAADATPNTKPRKQSKRNISFAVRSPSPEALPQPTTPTKSSRTRRSTSPGRKTLLLSPHANNPAADYIPPIPSLAREHTSSRRRSVTPVPPYEPPAERFTPPREIVCSPVAATTPKPRIAKRKAVAGGKPKKLVLQIKKEFPDDVDLSAPLPPPSPTEDPLLLRGPDGVYRRRHRRASSHPLQTSVYARDTPPMASTSPIRDVDMDATRLMDLNLDSVMDMTSDDTMNAVPTFDFTTGVDGLDDSSSDNDDEPSKGFEESGDFTGNFTVLKVPTKDDPPSDGTLERMEAWGRPISPHPRALFPEEEQAIAPSIPNDIFSPSRRAARSPPRVDDPSALSPIPQREDSPLPPSDEEPPSPVLPEQRLPRGPFDFDSLEEEGHPDDDMYDDQVVPIHDTSLSSIVLDEEALPSEDLPRSADREIPPDVEDGAEMEEDLPSRSGQSPTPSPRRPSRSPSSQHSSEALPPSSQHSYSSEEYRSPQPTEEADISDDEEEDEVSVVRELSQPPEPDDNEDATADQVASSFAKFNLLSSPNPFDLSGQQDHESFASHLASIRRPQGPLVAERSRVFEQSPAEHIPEFALSDDDGDDDMDGLDTKVIKITSEDPMAAARAAAILRLHKYDCLEQPPSRSRRKSGIDSILRKNRRKSALESGIKKTSTPLSRRQSLGGMIGDKVYIPGSPMMTLPQLLHEAEQSLHVEDRSTSGSPFRSVSPLSYKTPAREPSLLQSVLRSTLNVTPPVAPVGPRLWCKDDWKTMDSCYTDERLNAAELAGLGPGEMVHADEVNLESVVDRFIDVLGGEDAVVALGESWTRDDLLKRARALQRKQRSGRFAPPTPSRAGSVLSIDSSAPYQRFMSSMSPEASSHSSDVTIAESYRDSPSPQHVKFNEVPDTPRADVQWDALPKAQTKRPSTIASRVTGFLFSYLPLMSRGKSTPAPPKPAHLQPGLPLPPPDFLLLPRQPITTPAAKPAPKVVPPKELVQLHPAPPPEKPSMIPRAANKNPRRLVELNHVSPPPEDKSLRSSTSSLRRRDSNASVRDLVKSFEIMEHEAGKVSEADRQRSIEEWNVNSVSARQGARSQKPTWKP